jgi:hypothetical protein
MNFGEVFAPTRKVTTSRVRRVHKSCLHRGRLTPIRAERGGAFLNFPRITVPRCASGSILPFSQHIPFTIVAALPGALFPRPQAICLLRHLLTSLLAGGALLLESASC